MEKWQSPCRSVTLYHGEALSVMRDLEEGSIDAIVTDPPYCSGGATKSAISRPPDKKYSSNSSHPAFTGDYRDQMSMLTWVGAWMAEAHRASTESAKFLVFTDWRQIATAVHSVQFGGWIYRGIAVWDKTEAVRPQLGRFRNQAEYVVWGSKGAMPLKGAVLPGVYRTRSPNGKERFHLTGKPVDLMERLLEFTEPGGTVLDPFMGGGSTAIAALNTGRRFVGVEISRHYFEETKRRIIQHFADSSLLGRAI